jgi:hypothetical protein
MNPEQLTTFLKVQKPMLTNETLNILRNNKVDGEDIYTFSKQDFVDLAIAKGQAHKLYLFIKDLKERPSFSPGKISYFSYIPPSFWSLEHFNTWVRSCWPSHTHKDNDNKYFFYLTLSTIRDDNTISPEISNTASKLLKSRKEVSSISFISHNILLSCSFYLLSRISLMFMPRSEISLSLEVITEIQKLF